MVKTSKSPDVREKGPKPRYRKYTVLKVEMSSEYRRTKHR